MSLLIYRFTYLFFFILLHLLLPILPKKLRLTLLSKWQIRTTIKSLNLRERPILIHAASGEIEYAKPIIRELKRNYPRLPIIVIYSSPSLLKLVSGMSEVEKFIPAPFDFKNSCMHFLNSLQPSLILYARTDVWPEFSLAANSLKLPQILFSATFAGNSSRLKFPAKSLTRLALNSLTEIHVADVQDQETLQNKLQVASVVSGDTRYDQVFYRLQQGRQQRPLPLPRGKFHYVVFGSTWREDENALFSTAVSLVSSPQPKRIKILWAPHEVKPQKIKALKESLIGLELVTYQLSEWLQKPADFDVLIIDRIGYLAELYENAIWAFVGGSFKRQVHSVMEPLACGLRVIVGPYHQNNREAVIFSQKIAVIPSQKISRNLPLVIPVKNKRDLNHQAQTLTAMLTEYEGEKDRQEIKSLLHAKTGGTQRLLKTCEKYLRT